MHRRKASPCLQLVVRSKQSSPALRRARVQAGCGLERWLEVKKQHAEGRAAVLLNCQKSVMRGGIKQCSMDVCYNDYRLMSLGLNPMTIPV